MGVGRDIKVYCQHYLDLRTLGERYYKGGLERSLLVG